jgi:HSP90 family molecular chaperone
MMRMVEQANAGKEAGTSASDLPPQVLEINPKHPLVRSLFALKDDPNGAAVLVAEQLFDNALISAGLLEDARSMLPRLNEILLASLKKKE